MKSLLRNFLINLIAIIIVSKIIPAFFVGDGFLDLIKATIIFMVANVLLVPLIKILLLPLNLLTFGLFAWLANVIALYLLVKFIPTIKLFPFFFTGLNFNGFIIPSIALNSFQTAVLVSLLLGFIIHFIHWLSH